jgi:hypothetical protein
VIGPRFAGEAGADFGTEFGVEPGGQLALTSQVTGPLAECRCGGVIAEQVTLTARVWVHVRTGHWVCAQGGQAFPVRYLTAAETARWSA